LEQKFLEGFEMLCRKRIAEDQFVPSCEKLRNIENIQGVEEYPT
jgi:hypothetical protein